MVRSFIAAMSVLLAVVVSASLAQEAATVDPMEKPYASSKTLNLTPEQEARLKLVTREVLCACKTCPPTLLDDCLCGTARELKDGLKARLLEGASTDAMLAEYVAANGEQYLAAPPKQGFHWVIWVFPSVAFVALGAAFWVVIQRLARLRPVAGESKAPSDSANVARYRDEIERQVNERSV